MRVVIVDDERPSRGFLASMLGQCPDVAIVGEATNGLEAIPLISELRPDVVFLDLEMPGMTGPQLVGHLKGARAPLIVFVTAHDDYAVKAFEVEAVHYLMKPVALARLREALDRVQERLDAPSAPEPPPAPRPDLDRIPIRHRGDIVLLPIARVASVVAERELLHVTTERLDRYTITYRLKDLHQRIGAARFVRLSRGCLVNRSLIARVVPLAGGRHAVVLRNGQTLPVSRIQSRILRSTLLRL